MHALGYAILGALAVASGLRWPSAVLLAVGIGLLLEIAQRISGYRSFEWGDLAADAVGCPAGGAGHVAGGTILGGPAGPYGRMTG